MTSPSLGSSAPARTAAPVAPVPVRNRSGVPGAVERGRIRVGVGAMVRERRGVAGLSQRALASLAGCHPRTVERLEAGQLRPTSALLDALAHALTVPAGYAPVGRRGAVAALAAELAAVAGPSLVSSTLGGARRRRRRLRAARRAAKRAVLPALRAAHGVDR